MFFPYHIAGAVGGSGVIETKVKIILRVRAVMTVTMKIVTEKNAKVIGFDRPFLNYAI